MNVIGIIGRTCSGKTTVAKQLSVNLNMVHISVGELIRMSAKTNETVAMAYLGKDGFTDAFIYEQIKTNLLSSDISRIIIEGSIGLGKALDKLHKIGTISNLTSFFLSCSVDTRFNRYVARQKNTNRAEHAKFFKDREKLFDRRLDGDIKALRKLGNFYQLDCALPLEVAVSIVCDAISFEE